MQTSRGERSKKAVQPASVDLLASLFGREAIAEMISLDAYTILEAR